MEGVFQVKCLKKDGSVTISPKDENDVELLNLLDDLGYFDNGKTTLIRNQPST